MDKRNQHLLDLIDWDSVAHNIIVGEDDPAVEVFEYVVLRNILATYVIKPVVDIKLSIPLTKVTAEYANALLIERFES